MFNWNIEEENLYLTHTLPVLRQMVGKQVYACVPLGITSLSDCTGASITHTKIYYQIYRLFDLHLDKNSINIIIKITG